MLKKGSKLYSILTGTCPRCQNEQMYVNKNPYNISETMKMHEHCSHCGLRYKMEPNFFFGAMYVSYGLAVMVGFLIFIAAMFLMRQNMMVSFMAIVVGLVLLMPIITRLSRNIYINMFINYNKEAAKKI